MIDFLSSCAGLAELPSLNQRATMGKSSPGGEDTGEGELNLREHGERHFLCCSFMGELYHGSQSALTRIPASDFRLPLPFQRVGKCRLKYLKVGKSTHYQKKKLWTTLST
jgi:hypothetical protein